MGMKFAAIGLEYSMRVAYRESLKGVIKELTDNLGGAETTLSLVTADFMLRSVEGAVAGYAEATRTRRDFLGMSLSNPVECAAALKQAISCMISGLSDSVQL